MAGGRARRASAGSRGGFGALALINRWRVAGLFLAAAAATWAAWLVTSHEFDLDPAKVQVSSLVYTQPEQIDEAIGLAPDETPNVFHIQTLRMERALRSLSAVAGANVSVRLPDRLIVEIVERAPTFVLVTTDAAYVVDVDGYVLDELAAADAASLGLPVVVDRRIRFAPDVTVGGRLDDISLQADLRLAGITPDSLQTSYGTLVVTVDDEDGYVMAAEPGGWRAIFGHYTPNLRPVDVIDRQVQCLRARITAGEADVAVIYLAPLDERCGTFLPRTTPTPAATP